MNRRGIWLSITIVTTVLTLWVCAAWLSAQSAGDPDGAVNIKIQLPGSRDHANLVRNHDGSHSYIVMGLDGSTYTLTPDQFAGRVYESQSSRSLLALVFNISSPLGMIWVGLGLLGQLMFTGRMIVQWLVSEKSKRSIVPPLFWWFSLAGSMMLLTYFLWRRDVVGILGQGIGLAIYVRNLQMIYFPLPQTTVLVESDHASAERPAIAHR